MLNSLLHAARAGMDPDRYLQWRVERDGDPFVLQLPGVPPVLLTGHPDGAREVFRASVDILEPPTPNPIAPLVGESSLILVSGDRHRRDRKLMMPPFHGERMRAYGDLIRAAALAETDSWRPGATVDARRAARSITMRVILEAVFGVDSTARRTEYERVVADFLESYSGALMLVPQLRRGAFGIAPWDRFLRERDRFDRLLTQDIEQRRAHPDDGRVDILGMLLSATYDDGSPIADDDLREQLRTMLVAGHETTATTVVWTLFHLHRHPEILAKLRAEIGDDLAPERLTRLPYLTAVCNESMRLHPPVPGVLRRVTAPLTVQGRDLAPGDTVAIALPLLHRRPEVWGESPEEFRPERFLTRKFSPFEFAPFGGGHRRCIGFALAEYEMRIVVATIVAETRLELGERDRTRRPPPAVPHNIATGPRRPIRFRVVDRIAA